MTNGTFRRSLLSGSAIDPYNIVALSSDGSQVTPATDPSQALAGTTGKVGASAAGVMVDFDRLLLGRVRLGDTVSAGDPLTTSAVSRAIKATTSGQRTIGNAEQPGVAGDVIDYLALPGIFRKFGVAAAVTVVPIDANNAYVVVPNAATGGAIRYHLGRNQGSPADATDLGTVSPVWRVQGVADLATTSSDPSAPLAIWSEDVGNQDYAFKVGNLFGGRYHGIGAGGSVVQSITVNGVAVDLTQAGSYGGGPLVITATETIAFPGNPLVIALTTTIGLDGSYSYTFGNCSQGAAISYGYAGMTMGTGNYVEADVGSGSNLVRVPALSDRGIMGAATRVRMRNVDDGRTIDYVSNAPSIANFARKELDRYPTLTRTKVYDRFSSVASLSGLTVTMIFGRGAAGASSFGANLITNGAFASDLSGWTQTSGTTTWAGGKAQQTSSASVQEKLTQLVSGLDTTAQYLFTVNADNDTGAIAFAAGINTNGSTTGANFNQTPVIGVNSQLFTPSQAQIQFILLELAGTAGLVVNWDDVSLVKLAATA